MTLPKSSFRVPDPSLHIFTLQALAVPQDQAEDWYKLESDFRLIVGKIQTHYDFLDGFMTNAETTNQLELEDYARSIIQPGKKYFVEKNIMWSLFQTFN